MERRPITIFIFVLFSHFFLLMLILLQINPVEKPPQYHEMSTYLVSGSMQSIAKPAIQPEFKQISPQHLTKNLNALESPTSENTARYQPNILAASKQFLQEQFMQHALNKPKNIKPVMLIGDPNTEASPLMKLIATALSTNFNYPAMEGNFGITGKVLVELTFHPEGFFSDIEIVESSGNDHLDSAALYAVNKAPHIAGADKFLSQPQTMIIGFIFH